MHKAEWVFGEVQSVALFSMDLQRSWMLPPTPPPPNPDSMTRLQKGRGRQVSLASDFEGTLAAGRDGSRVPGKSAFCSFGEQSTHPHTHPWDHPAICMTRWVWQFGTFLGLIILDKGPPPTLHSLLRESQLGNLLIHINRQNEWQNEKNICNWQGMAELACRNKYLQNQDGFFVVWNSIKQGFSRLKHLPQSLNKYEVDESVFSFPSASINSTRHYSACKSSNNAISSILSCPVIMFINFYML